VPDQPAAAAVVVRQMALLARKVLVAAVQATLVELAALALTGEIVSVGCSTARARALVPTQATAQRLT
jgi:hypothetical protein